MNVDEIFKVRDSLSTEAYSNHTQIPKFASSSLNKRKLPDNPSPEILQKLREEAEREASREAAPPPPKRPRNATVEDADDEDVEMESTDFAPGGDADYFQEEDDEGRFFGGGLTSEQKDILNIFDRAGGEGVQADVRDLICSPSILAYILSGRRVIARLCSPLTPQARACRQQESGSTFQIP